VRENKNKIRKYGGAVGRGRRSKGRNHRVHLIKDGQFSESKLLGCLTYHIAVTVKSSSAGKFAVLGMPVSPVPSLKSSERSGRFHKSSSLPITTQTLWYNIQRSFGLSVAQN